MYDFSYHTFLSFLSGGFCLLVTILVVSMGRTYTQRVRLSFGALSLSCAVWATTYGLQLMSSDPTTATHWAILGWLGAIPAPTLWFVFVLAYTNTDKQLTREAIFALAVEPVVSVVLAVSTHPLFLVPDRIVQTPTITVVVPETGLGFGIHLVYTFVLCVTALGLLVRQFVQSRGLYRRQTALLLVSGAFPLVSIAAGLSGLAPRPHVDVTPMVLSVSMATALLALQRYQLFDVTPIARDITFEQLRDGIFVLDGRHRLVEVNAAARTLVEESDPIGAPAASVLPEASTVLGLLDDDEPTEEITIETDDATKTYEVTHTDTPLGTSGATGHILVFRDITDYQRVEAQFRAVVENSRDLISVVDETGTRRYSSPSTANILGYEPDDLVDVPAFSLVHPKDRPAVRRAFDRAKQTEEAVRQEFRIQRVDGAWRTFEAVAVKLSEGSLAGSFVVNSRDVTERQQYEQRLSVFNRVLRHDLRNEVNVILGYADLLESEPLSSTGHAYLDRIQRKATSLAALGEKTRQIDYTLDDTRRTRRPVNVSALVEDCVEEAHCLYPDATVSYTTSREVWVVGDDLLEVALSNLIDNAVEHNDTEQALVDVELTTGDDGTDGWVELAVSDNGPGIPRAEQRVLEEGSETPLEHVSGLGLWLVAWVVKNLNGELGFRDNEPRGSVVTIRLTATAKPDAEAAESTETSL